MNSQDIIKDASDALQQISDRGITVMQGWYDKDIHETHVTLWDLGEVDENFSDDDAEGVTLSLQDMTETVTPLSETVSQIVRSRTCGCRDFYIAKITQNDATGYVAGTPVKLARAIKAKVDEKWTSEKIYSDDGTEEVINSYEGTEVELEVNALAPQDRQILFGQLYENGFLIKTADDKAPEVAVGWRERKLNGKYDFKWLYAGKFAEGISEEASTKEGKLSPTTKSIKGSFYERSLDNAYEISVDESNLVKENTKAAEAIKSWFSKVQEKNDAAA